MPDFEGLAAHLLSRIRDILPSLVPGGKIVGAEYECGSINGGQGKSFRINLNTGLWADFAANQSGSDVTSLYAAIHNLKQSEAAEQLAQQYNFRVTAPTTEPSMSHVVHGKPSGSWAYRDKSGAILFYVARYDTPSGKEFMPWTWNGSRWHAKAYPEPRPLYGLDKLNGKPCLIVEGERTCEAARELLGSSYNVVTWSGGAKAYKKTDWTPVYGKRCLLWPDADEPGMSAMNGIAAILTAQCPEVKLIKPDPTRPKSWDAADALSEQWTTAQVIDWAKSCVSVVNVTINNNLTVQVDEPPAAPTDHGIALWDRLGLSLSTTGNPICNENNIVYIFEREKHLSKHCWFDDFHNQIFIQDTAGPRQWTDIDTLNFTLKLQREYGLSRISDVMVWRAIMIIANREHRNEPMDWMNTLEWDGQPRIEQFMCTHLGAKSTPYVLATSKNFWISMVARVFSPGCIMRSMVILVSKQMTGKSTAFSIIGGKWYSEVLEDIHSNNFLQSLPGNIIMEFGDLAGMDRAEKNRVKQIISCRKDRFRIPYARLPSDHSRQCVLVGSTNDKNFLNDSTGGTRFWPIETGIIDQESLIRDRNQLFAETVERFKNGEKWHEMPTEETADVQESYRMQDIWYDKIVEKLDGLSPFEDEIQVIKIATEFLNIPVGNVKKGDEMRIGTILGLLKWERFKKRVGTKTFWYWKKPLDVPTCEEGTFFQ
jgi:predicted P-loop ATPase